MKQLTLRITSFHRLTPDQVATKTFDRVGGVIGRATDADWILPDPEKIVSSTHAVISFEAGSYSITDYSTNGLFINRAVEPLGRGQSRMLLDGDYLQIGEYEVDVEVKNLELNGTDNPTDQAQDKTSMGNPDMMSQQQPQQVVQSPLISGASFDGNESAGREPVDTSAISSNPLNQSYSAPAPMTAQPRHENQTQSNQIPEEWEQEIQTPVQQEQPISPALATEPDNHHQPSSNVPHNGYSPDLQVTPQTSQQAAPQMAAVGNGEQACLAALMKGLGLSADEIQLHGQPEFYHRLGAALRLSLQGMLDILRARASMKSEFRVMQTTIRTQENNPLKFSINVDEAIRNLFARRIPGFLSWDQAIQECFKDMSSHELALMAGTEGAVNAVLEQLDPQRFDTEEQSGKNLEKWIPVAKKAKNWDRYKDQYKRVNEELGQGSGKRFSEEFAEAYEAQLTALGVR